MKGSRQLGTALLALSLAAAGFAAGGTGAAWLQRDVRAERWRKLHVEHEGTKGTTTKTRVVFENPALALQAVEVTRSPEGAPALAHAVLRDGRELTIRYQNDLRPTSLEAPDGSRAVLVYGGGKVRVELLGADKVALGSKTVTVPAELRRSLRDRAAAPSTRPLHSLWRRLADALVPEAHAEDADAQVTVVRRLELGLDIRTPGAPAGAPGTAQIDASCPPFTCVPITSDAAMPGLTTLFIAVTGSVKRASLAKPLDATALAPFRKIATAERSAAARVLPDVSTAVAAIGVTALACKSLKLAAPMCVADLAKEGVAGGASHAVSTHEVATTGRVVDARAQELFDLEQARAALDRPARVEVCANRDGYARACAAVEGSPLGPAPMPRAERAIELRRGIGGTLVGSFVMIQVDGPDCRFSPSPRTSGALRLTFDDQKGVMTGSLHAEQRGTRADLRCSLGTANMLWSQNYTINVSQAFTPLQAGAKLPLQARGTMNGVGSFSFSNCRTAGGVSANCPAGKNEGYSYPVELVGELDPTTRTGSGRIVVSNAPLVTTGTWRVPAEDAR